MSDIFYYYYSTILAFAWGQAEIIDNIMFKLTDQHGYYVSTVYINIISVILRGLKQIMKIN